MDGREILYVLGAQGVGVDYLMRMRPEPGARPERLAFAGDRVVGAAISARGNRLAYTVDLSDVDIRVIQPGGTAHSLISSTRTEMSPQFSPDGTRIAFSSDRTGVMEIWTCDQDGSNPAQLTHFRDRPSGSPSWSPDGRTIAFDSRLKEGGWRVFRMGSDSGQSRRLTQDDATELVPSWSMDGKTIYFASDRTGRFEIWQLPAGGGKATQVTKNGGFVAFESRDGRRLYYTKSDAESPIWMQPVEGGAEKMLVESVVSRAFVVEEDGIYYVPRGMRGAGSLQFYRFATGLSEPIAALQERIHLGLSVSSDRKTFLYAGNARTGRNLMLVDGFK